MAVTKTNFINYLRCPRFVALEDIKKNKLDSYVSFEEYKEEENGAKIQEILSNMYDEDDNDLLEIVDEQLEVMLPYYNEIEILAGSLAPKYFKGNFKFAYNTQDQESFDCDINGIKYICYTDIYNEVDDHFNIIEVKATTSKKFLSLSVKQDGEENSIFSKGDDGIYYLLEDLGLNIEEFMPIKKYEEKKMKLFERLGGAGKYVYDLAVQRYIIENDLRQTSREEMISLNKYYLGVLNCEYVFDGVYENGKPVYDVDENFNDIVCFFDMTSVTKQYMELIDIDRKKVESNIRNLNGDKCRIGPFCENKKSTKCKFFEICWDFIPKKNSILNYIDNHHGFKDESGNKYERYDLLNSGLVNLVDMPSNYLNRYKNQIQKRVVETSVPYINKEKIKAGIGCIEYPIYHLDFETFPCPLPRFKGEKPYYQSLFQFSIHIENEYGVCDKELDHYEFLAKDEFDNREELLIKMLEYIDVNKGTVLVYNESFEKTRIKELAVMFPEYKNELLKLNERIFDLMNLTKTKSSLYKELGFNSEESSLFNYYHKDMIGSFSIKKILPLFTDLTYVGMEIGNGIQALVTYAKFPKMDEAEFKHKYQKLIEYCKQDTWAMVEILWGLIEEVNK